MWYNFSAKGVGIMSRTILVIDNAGEQLKRLSELLENNYKIIESAANEQVLGDRKSAV